MTAAESDAQLSELDKQSHLHPFTSVAGLAADGPLVFREGSGTRLKDTTGKEYLDAFAGLWCVNVGYGREEIAEAVASQTRRLAYYHSFLGMANEPSIRLADRVVGMAPSPIGKAFFGLSGSDGNDTQIKLIWYYNNLRGRPEKKKLIARRSSYHGVTVASGSLSGLPNLHGGFDLPVERFLHVTTPHHYRFAAAGMSERDFSAYLAKELEDRIVQEGPETVAAFFAEPVMGAGGVFVPPEGYFEAIVPVLKKYDVLLVADEVICGFGRLGTMFGSNRFGLEPDLMTLAKGLTSGYVPMSACLVSNAIWEVLRDGSAQMGPLGHGFTYSAHPVAAAAALANLDILERERLVDRAAKTGEYLHRRLRESIESLPLVGEVRGLGLVAGLEIVANKERKESFDPKLNVPLRIFRKMLQAGVIVRPIPNTVAISPPLILTEAEVDEALAALDGSIRSVADELVREGVAVG